MKGWYFERWRHSLAARGIRTSLKTKSLNLNGPIVAKTHGIPITIKDPPNSRQVYPVTPIDVKKTFDAIPKHELVGISEINFRHPGIPATKQDKAWAQYVRSDKRINVFTQKFDGEELLDVDRGLEAPEEAREYMLNYVLPHEAAHHTIQYVWGFNNDPMIKEEARADAKTFGYYPLDKKVEKAFMEKRKEDFGPKGSI
jgi:hypothetical protein